VKAKKKPVRKKTARKAPARKRKAATKAKRSTKKTKTRAKAKSSSKSKAPARKRTARAAPAASKKQAAAKPPASPVEAPAPEPEKLPSIEEALATLPYGEGSFVVHPKYGLGKVDRIRKRTLSTRTVPCLEISFPYQDMRLTIPVDQVERSGLRNPIGRREIVKIFSVLKGRATFDAKRRSAKRVIDYRKRLNMGDPTSLAEAVRDLGRLSLKKSLSYEERKILSTALRILSREVALARGRDAEDVREEIEKIVYR